MAKTYLGDSVYSEDTDDGLVLTTENGGPPSNTIVLDAVVAAYLTVIIERRFAGPPLRPSTGAGRSQWEES